MVDLFGIRCYHLGGVISNAQCLLPFDRSDGLIFQADKPMTGRGYIQIPVYPKIPTIHPLKVSHFLEAIKENYTLGSTN